MANPFPDFDLAAAAARINRENRQEALQAVERKERARTEAFRLAGLLKAQDPNLVRVWGFGSTFEDSRPFHAFSDIDLAIEGGDLFSAISIVEDSAFRVDVIDITGRNDGFAKAIHKTERFFGQRCLKSERAGFFEWQNLYAWGREFRFSP